MSEEFYKKYRPKEFSEVLGQSGAVKVLEEMVKKNKVPHAILMSGPSGVGKTTLARILANKLGANEWDTQEINSANFRGIDTIRDISKNMVMAPVGGKCRVWIIDECFPAGTKVQTPSGPVNIEDVKPGDVVNNLNGTGVVRYIFKNHVELNRVVKVRFHDGTEIVCTKDHEVFTEKGWKKASSLEKDDCILTDLRYLKHNELEVCHGDRVNLRDVSEQICSDIPEQTGMLQQELCRKTQSFEERVWKNNNDSMQVLRQGNEFSGQQAQDILFHVVRETVRPHTTGISIQNLQLGGSKEDIPFKEREETTVVIKEDVGIKSNVRSDRRTKNDRYQDQERNVESLEGRERREWKADKATSMFAVSVREELEIGSISKNRQETTGLPPLLQIGHSKEEVQNRDRSGRAWSQIEESYLAGQKEKRFAARLRVDSVEVYQQGGGNRSAFRGVTDQDDREGKAFFYDLEVEGHPSYFANGIPVHNCHKCSNDFQNAFLKPLEDTPKHVYFMLCTTEPGKLITAVKSRTTEIKLSSVGEKELTDLVKKAAKVEGIKLTADVLEKLVENSEGSARKVLVSLEEISHLKTEDEQLNYLGNIDTKSQAFNLLECFFKKKSWNEVAKVLRGCDQEPEGIRQMLLASARTLLVGKDGKAPSNPALGYKIVMAFRDPIYDAKTAGQAQLAANCYEVLFGE